MKYVIILLIIIAGGAFLIFSSDNTQTSDTESQDNQAEMSHDVSADVTIPNGEYEASAESAIFWSGNKPRIPGYTDRGTLSLQEGTLAQTDTDMTGMLVFDMSTIEAQSTGRGSGADMLSGHLQSEDFFDVEEYPTAEFELTSLEPVELASDTNFTAEGQLTMKEITNPVSFPVGISVADDGSLRVTGQASLDRTQWDVRFGSDRFFDNLADNVIADTFTISFDLTFQPVAGAEE